MTHPGSNPLLQVSPFASDGGEMVGRDPRAIPPEDWRGTKGLLGLKAIRAKCIDCAVTAGEVRKCVQSHCALWPLRMGSVPKGFKKALVTAFQDQNASADPTLPSSTEPKPEPAHRAENVAEGAK